jgi:hypothetical protein
VTVVLSVLGPAKKLLGGEGPPRAGVGKIEGGPLAASARTEVGPIPLPTTLVENRHSRMKAALEGKQSTLPFSALLARTAEAPQKFARYPRLLSPQFDFKALRHVNALRIGLVSRKSRAPRTARMERIGGTVLRK